MTEKLLALVCSTLVILTGMSWYKYFEIKQELEFSHSCNDFKYEVLQEYDKYMDITECILNTENPDIYLYEQHSDCKSRIDSLYATQL